MRKFFTVLLPLFFVLSSGISQDLVEENGVLTYVEVVEVPGKSKTEIYDLAMSWALKGVVADQTKILVGSDSSNIEVSFSGCPAPRYELRPLQPAYMSYNLKISIKDGKYRVCFTQFVYQYIGGASIVVELKKEPIEEFKGKKKERLLKKAKNNVSEDLLSLSKWIQRTPIADNSEEW